MSVKNPETSQGVTALMPNVRGHIPPLDGLRGIAVLAVMTFHFSMFSGIPANTLPLAVWHGLSSAGWIGVDLFFVLSGFLITGILHDSKASTTYFRTFYARRSLRIFPLYYGVLAAFFLVLPFVFPGSAAVQSNTSSQLWYWTHLSNMQIALEGWETSSFYIVHFWSLAVEEQFYLVWPIVVLLLTGRRLIRFCGAVIAFSLLLRIYLFASGEGVAAFVLMPARMDTLAFGAVLAIGMRDPGVYAQFRRYWRPLAALCATGLCALLLWRGALDKTDPVTGTVGFTLLAGLFSAIMFFAVTAMPGSRSGRLLSSRPLRFFGKYSYALYVFHQPVSLVMTALGLPLALAQLGAPEFITHVAYAAAATAVSIGISLLSWHLYEKQFLKLRDRMSRPSASTEAPLADYIGTANAPG